MHAHLLSGRCDLNRSVVEFQPVERLIEVSGVSVKINGVSGVEFSGTHRNHGRIDPRIVVGHNPDLARLRCGHGRRGL